ncbi:MAG: carboxylesterase [Methyloversatilis sp.]|jgi:phospholipase/carboxylesterase|nr:carboxylesterase [Methyloversatilis sp.]MBP6193995.1 carboxylesterase [Methyloversatilis sp.]
MSVNLIELESGEAPAATVIVLHGLGADGNDFVPVCRALDLDAVGPVRFLLPDAPERPVTRNGGYVMRAWFDVFAPGSGIDDEAGIRASRNIVEALIAREVTRGVPASRIVLMGFSQGCALALVSGLRHAERLAGIAGLSGYLPLAARTAAERSPANRDVPVFLAHGMQDGVVDIERALAARSVLDDLSISYDWHTYDMDHEVCPDEIADLNRWLLRVLA